MAVIVKDLDIMAEFLVRTDKIEVEVDFQDIRNLIRITNHSEKLIHNDVLGYIPDNKVVLVDDDILKEVKKQLLECTRDWTISIRVLEKSHLHNLNILRKDRVKYCTTIFSIDDNSNILVQLTSGTTIHEHSHIQFEQLNSIYGDNVFNYEDIAILSKLLDIDMDDSVRYIV